MTATPNIEPDTAQFLAWLKDRLAAAEARGYQRGAAAARQIDSELTALAEENEKLRAELRRARGRDDNAG